MKTLFLVTLTCLALLAIKSCAPAYIPNAINTPMLTKAGEVQVSLNTGTAGFDPQLAVAVHKNIGIMVNGSFANRADDSTASYHRHSFGEVGLGYFRDIGAGGKIEVYGGGGYGTLNAVFTNQLWYSSSNVENVRFFVQPSIGATSDVFDGSFAARFVMNNLSHGSTSSTGYFVEPVLTGKVGYRHIKVMMQAGLSLPLNSSSIIFSYQPFIFNVGIHGFINRKFKEATVPAEN